MRVATYVGGPWEGTVEWVGVWPPPGFILGEPGARSNDKVMLYERDPSKPLDDDKVVYTWVPMDAG